MKFNLLKISLLLIVIAFSFSCNETRKTEISLGLDFTKVSSGNTIAEIPDNIDALKFNADIHVIEGIFNFKLITPTGDTIKNETYTGYGNHSIKETLVAYPGTWKMSYTILENDDLAPEGSFKLSLNY